MNVLDWKKREDLNTNDLEIGNYIFEIKTSKKIFLSDYNNIEPNDNLPKIKIKIWIEESEELKREFYNSCKDKKIFVPDELAIFYEQCNKKLEHKYSLKNKFNKYYKDKDNIFLCFNYITDKFYIYYKYGINEIFIIGNEKSLERIILDFLTVSSIILPIHSLAVKTKGGLGICILGESRVR